MKRLLWALGALFLLVAPLSAQQRTFIPCAAYSIAVTTTTSNVALGLCGETAFISNVGTVEGFYNIGPTATTSSYSIAPAAAFYLGSAKGQVISAITAATTTTIRITLGTLQ